MISYCVSLFHLVNYDGVKKENYSMKKITLIAFLLCILLACESNQRTEDYVFHIERTKWSLKCFNGETTMTISDKDADDVIELKLEAHLDGMVFEGVPELQEDLELLRDEFRKSVLDHFGIGIILDYDVEFIDGAVIQKYTVQEFKVHAFIERLFYLDESTLDYETSIHELFGEVLIMMEKDGFSCVIE